MKIIGIDIGTTSICGIVFDTEKGIIEKSVTLPNTSFIDSEKSYEKIQDPEIIMDSVYSLLSELITDDISAIGFSGQMHGIVYTDENGNAVPFHLGHYFIAINTEFFMGEAECRKKAGDIIRAIRAAKRQPGADRIYTAGEKEYEIRLARHAGVPINESVQKEFIAVRDELGLPYKFPFED